MPNKADIEVKVLDRKTAMDYKYHLLKLMIDLENSQMAFTPKEFKPKLYNEKEYIKVYGTIESQINQIFDSRGIIIALADNNNNNNNNNNIIGYTIVIFHKEAPTPTSASISYLYVDAEYRNMGLSKLLLDAVVREVKKSKEKILSIQVMHLVANERAGNIYKSMGFKDLSSTKYLTL